MDKYRRQELDEALDRKYKAGLSSRPSKELGKVFEDGPVPQQLIPRRVFTKRPRFTNCLRRRVGYTCNIRPETFLYLNRECSEWLGLLPLSLLNKKILHYPELEAHFNYGLYWAPLRVDISQELPRRPKVVSIKKEELLRAAFFAQRMPERLIRCQLFPKPESPATFWVLQTLQLKGLLGKDDTGKFNIIEKVRITF